MVPFASGSGGSFVGWNGSVRFGQRCSSIVTGERDRVGGARRRAPNTPGSPCHPRRCAVPSAYRVRLRVGRDTASCLSRPQAASLRLAPASRERLGEGDGVQHPRGTFRFLMGLKCRYEYEKCSQRQKAFSKKNREVGGVISQKQKQSCKT